MRTETLSFLIYLLSVGVLGLLGYQLFEKYDMRWVDVPGVGKPPVESLVNYRKKVAEGRSRQVISDRRWSYAPRMVSWWDVITKANVTGKLPPPPKEITTGGEAEAQAVVETPQTPLSEIITILTTFAFTTGTIKVQYKAESNVTGPKSLPLGLEDQGARMAPGQTQPLLGTLYQDLSMGESLYPPFEAVKAVRVLSQGSDVGVVFSRPAPDPADANAGKRVEETVWINQLDIQGNNFGGLASLGAVGQGTSKAKGSVNGNGTWQDPGDKTKKIGEAWQISLKDQKYLNSTDQLLEDVAVQDFVEEWEDPSAPGSGKKIRVRGVAITKISPRLKRFGVQEGEILIKINGRPVSGRANAMKLGKEEHNRGVRTFHLTFLNNYGREVVRTYQAPEK